MDDVDNFILHLLKNSYCVNITDGLPDRYEDDLEFKKYRLYYMESHAYFFGQDSKV